MKQLFKDILKDYNKKLLGYHENKSKKYNVNDYNLIYGDDYSTESVTLTYVKGHLNQVNGSISLYLIKKVENEPK